MRTIKIGRHEVEYYDAIDELPIVRYHKWQKLLLVDAGIGSDIRSLDQHLEKARRYCKTGKAEMAEKELMNLRQCVYLVQQELSAKHLAFAALVARIDGRECNDLSDDALAQVTKTLSDTPKNLLADLMESVKKKIDSELMLYFPKLFADSDVKEYYDLMRRRTIVVLNNIVSGEPVPDGTDEVERLTDQLVLYAAPKNFSGPDSTEVQYDKEFENLCLILSQQLNVDAKRRTVLEFYNAFEYLKDKKQKEKHG